MGCTRPMITRVMVYEMVSNSLASLTMGYLTGTFVSVLQMALFYLITELPLKIQFPVKPFLSVGLAGVITMYLGAKFGTQILFQKQISQILKGQ